jgi:hypothetical protein
LKELGFPETLDNFNKIYRPLLKEINENRIPSVKKGKGNIVTRNDMEEYIRKLQKEEQNKVLIYDKNTNEYVVNENLLGGTTDPISFKSSVQALITLYKNKIYTAEKVTKEPIKMV